LDRNLGQCKRALLHARKQIIKNQNQPQVDESGLLHRMLLIEVTLACLQWILGKNPTINFVSPSAGMQNGSSHVSDRNLVRRNFFLRRQVQFVS